MASKGNRVLKVKTEKARKMDREKGRAIKYTTKATPEGTAGIEKLPTKADVNLARKGKHITEAEAGEYTKQIDEYNATRAKKSSGGAIRGVKPEEKKSADVALERPLKAYIPEPKDIKEKAAARLTKRAEGLGIVPGMSAGSRKIVESELGDVQKKAAAKGRRTKEKEVEAGVASLAKRDTDLKPGQLSTAEKVYVKSGWGMGSGRQIAPHVEAARKAEVARQEKEAAVRKARSVDVGKLEELPKELPVSPGRPKERNVSVEPLAPGVRMAEGTKRRMGRKLTYNIKKAQTDAVTPGYEKASKGSEVQAKKTNVAKQKKFKNTQKRSLAVARNEDIRRDKEKQALLTAAEGLGDTPREQAEKSRLTKRAESLIRPPKEDIMGKGGRVIASGVQLGPETKRTIVDPMAIDKKYTRVVPVGAPRMMEKIKGMGPVSIKSGSNKAVTNEERMAKEQDPRVQYAANKAPKLEIVPLKSPEKTSGLMLRGTHEEALYSVAKHVFGEKNAMKNMKHVRTFAQNLSRKNRHVGTEQTLVSGMLGVLNKGVKPKTNENVAEHPTIDQHTARIDTLKSAITAHAKEAKGRAALKAEERAGKVAQIKAAEKEQNT